MAGVRPERQVTFRPAFGRVCVRCGVMEQAAPAAVEYPLIPWARPAGQELPHE